MSFPSQDQLPDQLVMFNPKQLQEFIQSSVESSIALILAKHHQPAPDKPETVYRTREYVKLLYHISYPTLKKHTDSGLLKCEYLGRRVLYDDAQLSLDMPKLQAILKRKKPPTV